MTFAGDLPYARGSIIRSTEDDFVKLQRAHRVIERRIAAVLAEHERARPAPATAEEGTTISAWRAAGLRGWTRP